MAGAPAGSAGAAATPDDAECLGCHGAIAAALRKRVVHAAMAHGCTGCHIDHRRAPPSPHSLKTPEPQLCLGCHQPGEKLTAAHQQQPFEKSVCTRCHDPHASKSSKLIYESAHGPFAGRRCEECHSEPEDGQVRLNVARVNEICYGCHVQLKNRIATAKSRHAAIESATCTGCHEPHASPYAHHLAKPEAELCAECHSVEAAGGKPPHGPAARRCTECHDPHTGGQKSGLEAGPPPSSMAPTRSEALLWSHQ